MAEEKNTDEQLLKDSREGLEAQIDAESDMRNKMKDDLRFAALDQWPSDLRAQRENDVNGARPCLTIDQINQYITQVSNDMSRNRPSIKTRPVDDVADPETSKIYQGLIRHIEDQSVASVAYDTAGDSAVTVGLGFVRVVTDYVSNDSFDQALYIRRVPDTFSVYLGPHIMPDGSDAEQGWIFEDVPIERFKREFPNAKTSDTDFAGLGERPAWKSDKTITVCEYFYREYEDSTLYFTADGKTVEKYEYEGLDEKPSKTRERPTQKFRMKWCKHTGAEILEKRDWPGQYVPIAEVVGKEKIVDGKRVLWGLVRPAKDSLRAYNYWISAMTEKMALSPKAPFIGAVGQFATAGDKWDQANVKNFAKLEYDAIDVNGNAVPPPRRQDPMQMEAGMGQMMSIMQNNVKSSLGMYKASIGDTESQQSGKAILALKNESDTGTSHFPTNQALMITHIGRILVDLIPKIYDKKRVIRILGEDGKIGTAKIDPEQPQAAKQISDVQGNIKSIYNLLVGTYDVTVTVGPGYTTSRQEAAAVMTELANTAKDPASAAILQYGVVKNSDFHGSDEIQGMLKAMLPPQVQKPEEMPPQAVQQIQQMQQQMQVVGEQMQALQQENQQLKSGVQEAQMKIQVSSQEAQAKIKADHEEALAQFELKKAAQDAELQLQRERADAEFSLKRWIAEQEIELKGLVAKVDAENQEKEMDHKHMMDMRQEHGEVSP